MNTSRLYADWSAGYSMIGPSLLAADFRYLAWEIEQLEAAGARFLHLDIMDGHFVPNLSFGVPIVEAVRRATDLPLDVHLMISHPADLVELFRQAGADYLTIHIELNEDPRPLLDRIRKLGAGPGLSLNPPTPVDSVLPYLDHCDLVLAMSVMPGFGGQSFQWDVLEKLRRIREAAPQGMMISVDGGVNGETIGHCAEAGATMFIVGTGLLGHHNYRQRFSELTSLIQARA